MLIIELNEYNRDLLERLCSKFDFPNIRKILSWNHCETFTKDTSSSGLLDPWCQWVSVHTGQPSKTHKIKNLGEVPPENLMQIWEYWNSINETSIVWGVMNGSRSSAELCKVFVPDPWTFTEEAFPKQLNGLIDLPRYLSKNYISPSKFIVAKQIFHFLSACLKHTKPQDWFNGFYNLFYGIRKFRNSNLPFICFFEWFSAQAFCRSLERKEPDHGILFLNLLAHAQHHYWVDEDPTKSPQLIYVSRIVDKILGRLLKMKTNSKKLKEIIVINAISQKNTKNEPAWVLYVPKTHSGFLSAFNINFSHVEPLMTYDAHVFFENNEEANRGEKLLKALQVNGKPLLHVERNSNNQKQFFYKVIISDQLTNDALINCENMSLPFHQCFTMVVERTGRHIQQGDILSNIPNLPKKQNIEEIFDYLK